jgi:hypothetical protein
MLEKMRTMARTTTLSIIAIPLSSAKQAFRSGFELARGLLARHNYSQQALMRPQEIAAVCLDVGVGCRGVQICAL